MKTNDRIYKLQPDELHHELVKARFIEAHGRIQYNKCTQTNENL